MFIIGTRNIREAYAIQSPHLLKLSHMLRQRKRPRSVYDKLEGENTIRRKNASQSAVRKCSSSRMCIRKEILTEMVERCLKGKQSDKHESFGERTHVDSVNVKTLYDKATGSKAYKLGDLLIFTNPQQMKILRSRWWRFASRSKILIQINKWA